MVVGVCRLAFGVVAVNAADRQQLKVKSLRGPTFAYQSAVKDANLDDIKTFKCDHNCEIKEAHMDVVQAEKNLHANIWATAATKKKLLVAQDQEGREHNITAHERDVEEQTTSPNLAKFLGNWWREMYDLTSPTFLSNLKKRIQRLTAERVDLEKKLTEAKATEREMRSINHDLEDGSGKVTVAASKDEDDDDDDDEDDAANSDAGDSKANDDAAESEAEDDAAESEAEDEVAAGGKAVSKAHVEAHENAVDREEAIANAVGVDHGTLCDHGSIACDKEKAEAEVDSHDEAVGLEAAAAAAVGVDHGVLCENGSIACDPQKAKADAKLAASQAPSHTFAAGTGGTGADVQDFSTSRLAGDEDVDDDDAQ